MEFSPVKNAPGNPVDSPDSARSMLSALHKGWITSAGATVVDGGGDKHFEISPLVSYGGEGLVEWKDQTIDMTDGGGIPADLRKRYTEAGQDHVFEFVDKGIVSEADTKALVKQLEAIDVGRVNKLFAAAMESDKAGPDMGEIQCLDSSTKLADASGGDKQSWYGAGLDAIARGEVALLVLSGGQGTRLGFAGPKGMYDIGLPSHKTLFQLYGERLVRLGELAAAKAGVAKVSIPWFVMTSPMNHEQTVAYFKSEEYFGLEEADVIFFPQGTLPCMTNEGKMMLQTGSEVGQASDGNGGLYMGLRLTGNLDEMKKRGIKYVHAYSVDNAICKVADPTFMGFCMAQGADCGNKVVWKANPEESVGVVAKRGGKSCVIEYSEMPADVAAQVDANGKLVYGAANICNHFYTIGFLEQVTDDALTYHVARKAIPYAGADGKSVKPDAKNGIKLECFIFDPFYLSTKMAVLEGERSMEFSPVKNAPGNPVDSPDSARSMLSALHKGWITSAGATVVDGEHPFEISPLVSYGGEGLAEDVTGATFDFSGEGSHTVASESSSSNASDGPTNSAYLFIKPHAANSKVAALVESGLQEAGLKITSKGELGYAQIDSEKLIDNHYGAIAAKATKLQPSELSPSTKAQADFKKAFGLDWTEALANGSVYNAMEGSAKLGLDSAGLDAKWGTLTRGVDLIKFGGGFYAGKIGELYIINGFYMAMRAKYTTAPAKILFYTVEWAAESMSWTDFRGKLIGATDPTSADAGSLRGKVYSQWESMGLSAQPDTGDNSVHASASPFEGLVERLNWVGAELDLDPFGKLLLGAGVSTENAMAYAQDPQVSFDGEMTSLFDLLEDTDADECCAKVVKVQAEAQEANAAATMIQSKRRQQEASREVTELRTAKVVEAGASKASCTGDKGQYQLQIGDVVQAKPPDETLYFEGVVVELHGDGAADVDFGHEDGDEDDGTEHKYSRVPKENIRRAMEWSTLETGDHVKARHDGGYQEFEAIVIAVHPDGTYDVRYDDDEVEEDVAADMLTKILSGRMQAARRWHKAKSMLSAVSFFRHTGSKDNAVVGSGRAATSTINSTPA
jgi:UDP-N-acetylglucosamine/UDP-N-acetylgalactosamine diphosphorylase